MMTTTRLFRFISRTQSSRNIWWAALLLSLLTVLLGSVPAAWAQLRPVPNRRLQLRRLPTTLRRQVRPQDHTRTTRIVTRRRSNVVGLGEAFEIRSTSLNFDQNRQRIEVRLFDTRGRIRGPQVLDILDVNPNRLTIRTSPLRGVSTFQVEVRIFENGQLTRFARPGLLGVV